MENPIIEKKIPEDVSGNIPENTAPAITDYFGFDLGDGESAVAWMRAGRRVEPQMIELRGRKSVITALASHPERGLFIGEEACHLSGADWLELRFKSRYLTDEAGAGALIVMFAREILSQLMKDGRLETPETACFFIGCPSGWPQETRAAYKKLFERVGMVHCDVVSESRAAFMFARESGELRVSDDLLTLPTLIIDAGSSTIDFTFVSDLAERSLTVCDFGAVSLGGGLIDRLLLERNVRRSPERAQVEEALERFPQYRARCEFEARRVKEMYFTQAARGGAARAESAVKIYAGRKPLTLDIACNDADMAAILSQSVESLGGLSFKEAYENALREAVERLDGEMPQIILLTGGASRMPMIGDRAKALFPDAQVLRALEPEFSIARGLCYALRIDQKTRGFEAAVDALIRSDDMENMVLSRLSALFTAVSAPLTDLLLDSLAPEVFELWRGGGLKTFNDIGAELTARLQRMAEDGRLADALRPAVSDWVLKLRPDMEMLTDPICDQFDLPRTSLRLPDTLGVGVSQLEVSAGELLRMDQIKALIDVIVASLMAAILGGSGLALMAAGAPGLAVGFLVGLLAAVIGTETAERMLRRAELPLGVRRMITPRFFKKSLNRRRGEIRAGVESQLMREIDPPSQSVQAMVRDIAASIEEQLRRMMERAALLIH